MEAKNENAKVIIVGIDGASWNLINDGIKKGLLPNFEKIVNFGVSGKLNPPVPPLSPSSWTSIYTGVKPNKHKIYGFTKLDKSGKFFRFVTSKDRKSPPFWSLLPNNYRVVLFNLPFTYPIETVNGILVSGFGTPSINSNFVYPSSFRNYILKNFPNYNVDYNELEFLSKRMNNTAKKKFLDNIEKIFNAELEISKYLLSNMQFDIFFCVFRALDVVQHYFWDDKDIILKFYHMVDEFLSYVLDIFPKFGNCYLLVVSDHGFDRVHTYVYINNILENKNLLVIKKNNTLYSKLYYRLNAEFFKSILIKLKLRKLINYLRNSNLLWYLLKFVPSKSQNYFVNIDWSSTVAFFLEGSDGLIYINRKNRNINYINSLLLIKSSLENIKYNKEKVFSEIFSFYELYNSEPTEEDPDVILVPNRGYRLVSYNNEGCIFGPPVDTTLNERFGDHSGDGIFIAYGPNVKSGATIDNVYVWDILPTIFYILNIPIPSYIDGQIVDIFKNREMCIYGRYCEEDLIKYKIRLLKSRRML